MDPGRTKRPPENRSTLLGRVSCLVESLGSVLGFPVFIFFSSLLVTAEAKGDEWINERPQYSKVDQWTQTKNGRGLIRFEIEIVK